VETSHRRATSACVTPRANSPMPFFRRASMASRLRLVGRGFRSSDLVTSMSQHFLCYLLSRGSIGTREGLATGWPGLGELRR
jgi:hypothetical protein